MRFKFDMTLATLTKFQDFTLPAKHLGKCYSRCLEEDKPVEKSENEKEQLKRLEDNLNVFHHCVRNCEVPVKDILSHQAKAADIARLTLKRNVNKCQSIHRDDLASMMECVQHNTDKVDRRFSGYYLGQRAELNKRLL